RVVRACPRGSGAKPRVAIANAQFDPPFYIALAVYGSESSSGGWTGHAALSTTRFANAGASQRRVETAAAPVAGTRSHDASGAGEVFRGTHQPGHATRWPEKVSSCRSDGVRARHHFQRCERGHRGSAGAQWL